jgi:hypothetical protein
VTHGGSASVLPFDGEYRRAGSEVTYRRAFGLGDVGLEFFAESPGRLPGISLSGLKGRHLLDGFLAAARDHGGQDSTFLLQRPRAQDATAMDEIGTAWRRAATGRCTGAAMSSTT